MSKTALAKKLGISRSSLYYEPKRKNKDLELMEKIKEVMSKNPSYGHKRIAIALNIGKNRALRIMKLFGLEPKLRRVKLKYKIQKSKATRSNLIKNINGGVKQHLRVENCVKCYFDVSNTTTFL